MKIEEIRSIAKARHIKTARLSKSELIKSIQSEEGNFDCFATADGGECDQVNCIWRDDCFGAARERMLS
ncbi:MAG: SAP domain-containing protein [Gallionella sp.]